MKKFLLPVIMLFSLAVLFCACSKGSETPKNAVSVYYLNLQGNAIVSQSYVPASQDAKDRIGELLEQMENAPGNDISTYFSGKLSVNSTELNGTVLRLYLEGSRADIAYNTYILSLAALTRTLTQIDGVDAILVYINGEAVTDAEGLTFGIMRPQQFVNNSGQDEDDFRVVELKLFFANESGTKLTEQTRSVRCGSNTTLEKEVLRELSAGPGRGEGFAVIPQGTSVLSASTRDGICYINMDDIFASGMEAGREELAIYAIVNSITSLEGIEQVQIAVNGDTEVALGLSKFSLSGLFSFNIDIIEIKE